MISKRVKKKKKEERKKETRTRWLLLRRRTRSNKEHRISKIELWLYRLVSAHLLRYNDEAFDFRFDLMLPCRKK